MKKTTLNIDETVMARLKQEALRRKTTMGALVEAGIRRILAEGEGVAAGAPAGAGALPALPVKAMGRPLVDVADRAALSELLDREQDEQLYTPYRPAHDQEDDLYPVGDEHRPMRSVADHAVMYDASEPPQAPDAEATHED